jgi:excisionase family DNA binding protein
MGRSMFKSAPMLPAMKRDRYLRPNELAEILNVPVETIEHLIAQGELLTLKLPGGELRIDPQSVRHFLKACEIDVTRGFVARVS